MTSDNNSAKQVIDLTVVGNEPQGPRCNLLRLTSAAPLPEVQPGQFVNVRVDGAPHTFLRRPISINYVDRDKNELWLLVQKVGEGTRAIAALSVGSKLNVLMPLGNGFTVPAGKAEKILLVGGGVGVAPLLYLGKCLKEAGHQPVFLLGARSASDLLEMDLFGKIAPVYVTTEDGSAGEKGFVTQHTLLGREVFDRICTCGPGPMMKAVARYALMESIPCYVSLENKMACGLGACLCCVEDTKSQGHVCVCQAGPVINAKELKW